MLRRFYIYPVFYAALLTLLCCTATEKLVKIHLRDEPQFDPNEDPVKDLVADQPLVDLNDQLETNAENDSRSAYEAQLLTQSIQIMELKENEQRLVSKMQALSGQVESLTDQLVKFFSEAESRSDNHETEASKRGLSSQPSTLKIEATGGVTYTRWGRTACEGDAYVLYKGYAAGPRWRDVGGGADLLCIHEDPQWYRIIEGLSTSASVGGTVYHHVNGLFDTRHNRYMPLGALLVPCAVCHVQRRSHQVMIPARRECPEGWTREYWGYLMATRDTDKRGSHTCVDEAPESAGKDSTNEICPLFPVEARTFALKSPPYIDGAELMCVVCSK